MRYYGTKTPPDYNLSKVTVPTFILHSKSDHLSAVKVICLARKIVASRHDIQTIFRVRASFTLCLLVKNVSEATKRRTRYFSAVNTYNTTQNTI